MATRTWMVLAGLWALALVLPPPAPAAFLDAVLAETDEVTVTASEIGLARALGLFELRSTAGPIQPVDLQQFVDGRLLEREALRLQIEPTPAELEAAWRRVAEHLGGDAALTAWLARISVSGDWARRLVDADLRRRQFIDLRFRAFALVPPDELEAALGSGPHSEVERQRVEARLRQETVDRALRDWLHEARSRAAVRLVTGALPAPSPIPFP